MSFAMNNPLIGWHGFKLLPSAWLLLVQLIILIIAPLTNHSMTSNAISWSLSAIALLLIAKVIRQTPIYTAIGLLLVVAALVLSAIIALGFGSAGLQVTANLVEAAAYMYGAYGLLRYMFMDRYVTRDELFAAAALFTLLAWSFAFLYNACQTMFPASFNPSHETQLVRSWLELLFLSFSIQSGTGLSDIVPLSPAARVIAALQMFTGVMYLALVVSRLVAMQYVTHLPKKD
jgi:hypothetical protein